MQCIANVSVCLANLATFALLCLHVVCIALTIASICLSYGAHIDQTQGSSHYLPRAHKGPSTYRPTVEVVLAGWLIFMALFPLERAILIRHDEQPSLIHISWYESLIWAACRTITYLKLWVSFLQHIHHICTCTVSSDLSPVCTLALATWNRNSVAQSYIEMW